MSEFSPRAIDSFRRSLAEQRAQLVIESRTKLAEAKDERIGIDETSSVDVGDRAFLEQASELDLAMAERDIQELREVDAAMERLANGTYGACGDCVAPIVQARLQAFPSAYRCNACQTAHEAQGGNPHRTT